VSILNKRILIPLVVLIIVASGIVAVFTHKSSAADCGKFIVDNETLVQGKSPFAGCFDQHLNKCQPATKLIDIEATEGKGTVNKYMINKTANGGCQITWTVLALPTHTEWENQSASCLYKKSSDFYSQLVNTNIYSVCKGALIDSLKHVKR
jgi:hypothetical protein